MSAYKNDHIDGFILWQDTLSFSCEGPERVESEETEASFRVGETRVELVAPLGSGTPKRGEGAISSPSRMLPGSSASMSTRRRGRTTVRWPSKAAEGP